MARRRRSTAETGLPRVLRALLAPAVTAVVLGIVGMHALQPHEAMAMGAHASGTSADAAMTATMSMSTSMSMSTPVSAPTTRPTLDSVPEGVAVAATARTRLLASNDGTACPSMVMFCAFMVLAAGFVLLIARAGSRWAAPRRRPPPWSRVVASLRRATGPPAVWEHSVIRC